MLKKIIIVIIVLLAANLAAQEAQLSPEQLFLRFQIESGTLAELQAMAAALGLNSNASLEELRVNLLSYHNLPPTAAESRIVIEQADNFFRGDPSELNEITRLEGNVLLTLIDEDGEHTISAHMVEIDTLNQIIFAGGNVTYQMAGGASFNSNYLIFESDNFSGLIIGFSGSSEAALVADAALIFHYRANLLRRSTNNVLVIDGITITSSRPNDPYYHIRASRLWLLGEGEWAARNLALFIGRVPVFYLPFYYQGDIIFFNPVFGYRLREGFYVNTTTYLLGSKPDGGLLNFNFFNNQTAAAEEPVTLKIMLDYYQRLGFFGGIGFDFAPLNLRSMAGVGFSRSIDEIGNLMEEDYNHSYLFGRQMPFRYGFTLEANHQNRLTIGLNFFSDNRFRSDFFSRSESGLLFGIINFGSFGNFDDATSFADTTTNNSFIRYRNSFTFNNPIVRYLHIDFLNIEINERVRIDTTQHLYNPLRNFYVPTMFNLPNSQFRFGSRYTLNFNNNRPVAGVDESDDNEDDLFYAEDLEEHTFLEEDDEGNLSNLNQPRQPQNWQQAIFYEHTLGSRVFSTPNFNTFNHASEVRFNFDDLRNLTTLRSHVGYSFGTVSSLLRLEHRIGLSAGHQQRFAGDDERTPAEEREDNLARNLNLSHQFTLNYRPFYDNARLNTSQFNYRLNYIFFNNHYNFSQSERLNEWRFNPTLNSADMRLQYTTGLWWLYLEGEASLATADLEDIRGSAKSGAGFELFYLSNEAYIFTRLTDNPLTTGSGYGLANTFNPVRFFELGQTSEWSIDNNGAVLNEFFVRFYGLSATYRLRERYLFSWQNYSWTPQLDSGGEQIYRHIPSELELRYVQQLNLGAFWRGRITTNLQANASWLLDLHRYNDSAMQLTLNLGFNIHQALTLNLTTRSVNNASFLYLNFMRENLGVSEPHSFWGDLITSFNFFNTEARRDSPFKLDSISLSANVNMHDWTLNIIYQGSPRQRQSDRQMIFGSRFTLLAQWKPIPALRSELRHEDEIWSIP